LAKNALVAYKRMFLGPELTSELAVVAHRALEVCGDSARVFWGVPVEFEVGRSFQTLDLRLSYG